MVLFWYYFIVPQKSTKIVPKPPCKTHFFPRFWHYFGTILMYYISITGPPAHIAAMYSSRHHLLAPNSRQTRVIGRCRCCRTLLSLPCRRCSCHHRCCQPHHCCHCNIPLPLPLCPCLAASPSPLSLQLLLLHRPSSSRCYLRHIDPALALAAVLAATIAAALSPS